MTLFGQRWIEQLLERYNALGPSALGDLRRGNGASAKVLKPELLERLRVRLAEPPPDGGVWTSGKVALDGGGTGAGLAGAAARLGGVAGDRLVDPEAAAAQPEGGDGRRARGLQKLAEVVAEEAARHPDTPVEAFATDEAPARPEAGDPSGLGAGRRAADRSRTPSQGECAAFVRASNGST